MHLKNITHPEVSKNQVERAFGFLKSNDISFLYILLIIRFHQVFMVLQTPFPSFGSSSYWSFHNLIELSHIRNKEKMVSSSELLQLQKLEKIDLSFSNRLTEVFEVVDETNNSGFNESRHVVKLPNLREVKLDKLQSLNYIWKSNELTLLEFPNLTKLYIHKCDSLKHVFTCSMVGSLLQLQELDISECDKMEVIVKEEEEKEERDGKVKEILLPCVKSLKLHDLSSLKGFCLGKEAFSWPSLYTLEIIRCPNITILTEGRLDIPEHIIVETSFGWFYGKEDINSVIKTNQQQVRTSRKVSLVTQIS